ncbi:hypothetical protein KIN20_002602, partial [Parelaphostrongylus tenuis]
CHIRPTQAWTNHLSPEMSSYRSNERKTGLGHPIGPECLHPLHRVSFVRDVLNPPVNKKTEIAQL